MDHQVGAQARGRSNPKARKTGLQPHGVYRWMLQELLYRRIRQTNNRVLDVRGGDPGKPSHSSRHVYHMHKTPQGTL